MTPKQFQMIENAIMYQGNRIHMFEDARTLKSLKSRGYVAEYKDGWYYVRVDAFLKAITYFRDHYTGAVEQHAVELTERFYANSEKLHNS